MSWKFFSLQFSMMSLCFCLCNFVNKHVLSLQFSMMSLLFCLFNFVNKHVVESPVTSVFDDESTFFSLWFCLGKMKNSIYMQLRGRICGFLFFFFFFCRASFFIESHKTGLAFSNSSLVCSSPLGKFFFKMRHNSRSVTPPWPTS